MRGCRVRAGTPATVRPDEPAEVSPAGAVDRPRGHPGGRARPQLRGPRVRRAAPAGRQAAAPPAVPVAAAVGRREPALLQLVRPAGPDGPERLPDLRAQHGGDPAQNRSFTVRAARTATALLCTAALAVGAAGCGGSEIDYQEVPGPPVDVPIPSGSGSAGGSAASDDASSTPTPTPTAEPGATTAPSDQSGATGADPAASTDSGAATGTGGTGTAGNDSGGATAPATDDSASNDTAPPAGSDAEQFEAFCAQNPGAC